MSKWIRSTAEGRPLPPGIRYREHATRKHAGKPDRYWAIYFRQDGKLSEQGLGWSTQGWNQAKAESALLEFKVNAKSGSGPVSFKEKREIQSKKKEAERAWQEAEKLRLDQEARDNAHFDQLIDSYVQWATKNKRSARMDESRCRIHLKPLLGSYPVKEITVSLLNDFRDALTEKNLSPATIKHCFVLIRQIFNHAINLNNFTGKNPVSKQNLPRTLKERFIPGKLDNRRLRFLCPDEADRLMAELARRSRTTHDIALVSLRTGARFEEIASLTWQNVDLFNDQIHIFGKNGETRQAFLTPDLKEMFLARGPGKPDSFVFHSLTGGQIPQISSAFWRAVEALKLNEGISDPKQKVVFYTLRHTFASWLAQQGTSLFVIQELMGHQKIEMTMRYSHLLPDNKRDAVMTMFNRHTAANLIRLSDHK